MKKLISILILIIGILAVGYVLAWVVALVAGGLLFSRGLNAAAELLHMPAWVASFLFWTLLVPFSYFIARTISPFRESRRRTYIFVATVLVTYWAVIWAVSQRRNFDPGTGDPQKWVDVEADGRVTIFDHPGFNPADGHALIPMTPALAETLNESQGKPLLPQTADPEKTNWFSHLTGKPILFYHRDATNNVWEFFPATSDMCHPRTGERLLPVSTTVYQEWSEDMRAQRDAAEKVRLDSEAAKVARIAEQEQQQREKEVQRLEAERVAAKEEAEEQKRLVERERIEKDRLAAQVQYEAQQREALRQQMEEAARLAQGKEAAQKQQEEMNRLEAARITAERKANEEKQRADEERMEKERLIAQLRNEAEQQREAQHQQFAQQHQRQTVVFWARIRNRTNLLVPCQVWNDRDGWQEFRVAPGATWTFSRPSNGIHICWNTALEPGRYIPREVVLQSIQIVGRPPTDSERNNAPASYFNFAPNGELGLYRN